jgi:hypothetical protein
MSETHSKLTQPNKSDADLERSIAIAKWLIPSFTALYLLVGFVAAQGHFSLLGFNPGLLASTSYTSVTIDFIRESLAVIVNSWNPWRSLLTEPWLLAVVLPALAIASLTFLLPAAAGVRQEHNVGVSETGAVRRLVARAFRWMPLHLNLRFLTWLLLAVVCTKIVLLDAPLFKLEGALIDLAETTIPGSAAFPLSARLERDSEGLQGALAKQSSFLWRQLACVRTGRQAVLTLSFNSAACEEDRTRYADRIDAEYLANLLSVAAVALISLVILRRAGARTSSVFVAWLCLFSCLTLPYAYGKLRHSTEYEFGEIALKTALDLGKGGKESEVRTLKGFAFIREGSVTTVATLQSVPCPKPTGAYKTEVRLWRISNSEIHWQREIYREDILRWKLLKERDDCKGVDAI